jgi:hypothetical protein
MLHEVRVLTKTAQEEMDQKVGKILTDTDYNVLLTGPTRVLKRDGTPLIIYLPGQMPDPLREVAYPILTKIRSQSRNRGLAGGAQRVKVHGASFANPVMSSIIGHIEQQGGRFPLCRTTAWSGENTQKFAALYPYFQYVSDTFRSFVPDRWAAQAARCADTDPAWVIPGTVFSTVTVNNTYPTGVHKDAGDLDEGFSCLTTLRRGSYNGGILTFPEYRVAVNLQDGDIILMDAHEWHGNTAITRITEDAERISVVLYYRTKMASCASPAEEIAKGNAKKVLL